MRTRVLLIENGHSGRSVLAQLFGLSGLTVHAFASIEEAEAHLESCEFDFALIDGDLPESDGIFAAEMLSLRYPAMRVVMMVTDSLDVPALQQRYPEIMITAKLQISDGILTDTGTGHAALCNN